MTTRLEAIQAKMKKLQAQAEAVAAKESGKVLATIRELMSKHGITTADIDAHARKPGKKAVGVRPASKLAAVAAVKYRDPKTGATWSGRGRAPQWIADAKNRNRFLVDGDVVSAKSGSDDKVKVAAKKSAKADKRGQPKGPQPALYRDPKTGSTWSGRGRAPAWLAGAKDRSKFLID